MISEVEIGDRRDQRKHRSSCSAAEEILLSATVMDRSVHPVIDALPSYQAISEAPPRSGLSRQRFRRVLGMFSSSGVQVPYPT
jgi:hypothetical protein